MTDPRVKEAIDRIVAAIASGEPHSREEWAELIRQLLDAAVFVAMERAFNEPR